MVLEVTNFHGELFNTRRQQGQGGQIGRMPIALYDLTRYRIGLQAEFRADVFFDLRPQMGKGSHRPGQLADGNVFAHRAQPFAMASYLFIPDRQLESERDRLAALLAALQLDIEECAG